MENIVNGFNISEEEIAGISNENLEPLPKNLLDYENLKIIKLFHSKNLLIKR